LQVFAPKYQTSFREQSHTGGLISSRLHFPTGDYDLHHLHIFVDGESCKLFRTTNIHLGLQSMCENEATQHMFLLLLCVISFAIGVYLLERDIDGNLIHPYCLDVEPIAVVFASMANVSSVQG
jgi:hypothetical protein